MLSRLDYGRTKLFNYFVIADNSKIKGGVATIINEKNEDIFTE